MKRYIIKRFHKDRSIVDCLIEISKSGSHDGLKVDFFQQGGKSYQLKHKNGSLNGLRKEWCINPENWYFQNWKKNKTQGIEIVFE